MGLPEAQSGGGERCRQVALEAVMEEEAVVVNAWYGATRHRRSGGTRCLWGVLGSPHLRRLCQGDIAPA
jgi:hypothetical protein